MNSHTCPECRNQFVQPFVCTTCGAQKLYDETVRSQAAEIQRLQRALHFWLPHVPADGPEEIAKRCGDDAILLVGYDPTAPVELDAEARGWITLHLHP